MEAVVGRPSEIYYAIICYSTIIHTIRIHLNNLLEVERGQN